MQISQTHFNKYNVMWQRKGYELSLWMISFRLPSCTSCSTSLALLFGIQSLSPASLSGWLKASATSPPPTAGLLLSTSSAASSCYRSSSSACRSPAGQSWWVWGYLCSSWWSLSQSLTYCRDRSPAACLQCCVRGTSFLSAPALWNPGTKWWRCSQPNAATLLCRKEETNWWKRTGNSTSRCMITQQWVQTRRWRVR